MNVVCFIQARMTSSRLPGKVLMPFHGLPLVVLCVRRLQRNGLKVVVLTSTETTDNPLCDILNSHGIDFYRGALVDVFDRFLTAIEFYRLRDDDIVIRLTADNLVPDADLLSDCIEYYLTSECEYLGSNFPDDGLPYGVNVELATVERYKLAATYQLTEYDKEHVTPIVKRISRVCGLEYIRKSRKLDDLSSHNFSIDTIENYHAMHCLLEPFNDLVMVPWHEICNSKTINKSCD